MQSVLYRPGIGDYRSLTVSRQGLVSSCQEDLASGRKKIPTRIMHLNKAALENATSTLLRHRFVIAIPNSTIIVFKDMGLSYRVQPFILTHVG